MKLFGIISLMVLFISAVRCQEGAAELVWKGKQCLEYGQVEQGLEFLARAIAVDPNDPEAYNFRARTYIDLKEFQKAIDDCTRMIELRPDSALGYILRGLSYMSINESRLAVADFTRGIERWPNVDEGYVYRALANANVMDFEGSVRDCTKAIALSPENAFLYFLRASSGLNIRQYDQAIADLRKVQALEPLRTKDCQFFFGCAYAGRHDYDSAIACMEKAVTDSATAAGFCKLGFFRLAKRENEKSISCFSRSIELDTTRGRCMAMLGLAAVYQRQNDRDRARSWLDRARLVEPKLAMRDGVLVGFEDMNLLDIEKRACEEVLIVN